MVGASRKKKAVEQGLDSDGEAPEQVSLSAGREDAHKLRREERGSQRRVQAEAKKRRQQRRSDRESQAQQQELPEARESIPDAKLDAEPPEANAIGQEEAASDISKSARNRGFLDASVVDLLSSKEKTVIKASEFSQAKDEIKEKRTKKRKKVKPLELTTSGINTVVLDANRPSLANVENAFQFKRKRLFGRRVHRSSDVLRKC